eukprot:COSAG01_NODE_1131_length_11572_cov_84.273337_8_plen_166_part_00
MLAIYQHLSAVWSTTTPQSALFLAGVHIRSFLRLKTLAVKLWGTVLIVSSGLAVGPEGPLVHMGAILGSGAWGALFPRCCQWLSLFTTQGVLPPARRARVKGGGGHVHTRGNACSSACCTCTTPTVRVRVEIMGSQKCRIVGKSQPVLIMISPIIFTRTRIVPSG